MSYGEPWSVMLGVERDLRRVAARVHPDYTPGSFDCWVLCPRAHAVAHLRCILELTPEAYPGLPGLLWLAKQTFAAVGRFVDGDDLVFAIGDAQ